jgi:hypothetical protein
MAVKPEGTGGGGEGRPWTPPPSSSPLSLEQERRLWDLIQNYQTSDLLTEWECKFVSQLAEEYESKGVNTFVSGRMWYFITRIEAKL